jgi:CubicO group peptidase (beta-lactamase class C family)
MEKPRIFLLFILAINVAVFLPPGIQAKEDCSLNPPLEKKVDEISYDKRFEDVRSKIIDLVRESRVASVSVAVAEKGRIIWEEAFGWANREERIKSTPHTMYSIASISKPMTATGLMILVEKGLLNLDKPLNDYLGSAKLVAYEGRSSEATVKRVLHHTSGLPLHWHFIYENGPYLPPSMDHTIRRYGILVAAPGEIYQYSNLGYGILGHVISRVSGKSYAQFMKSEVFLPLGMIHTSVGIGPGLEDYAAQRYDPDQKPIPFYDFDHPGASAVFSSAHDLVQFGMFHLKCHLPDQMQILKDETIDLMQRDVDSKCPSIEYKLGWRVIDDDHGYRSVSHTGGMEGVCTELKIIPAENIAVVVLGNNRYRPIYNLDNEILAAMLPKFAENLKAKENKSEEKKSERFSPPPSLLGEWEGEIKTYSGVMPVKMVFQEDGDIHLKIKDQLETLLNEVSLKEEILSGRCCGEIRTEDAARFPHTIELRMKLYDQKLSGYATANSGRWYGLSSWIMLKKTSLPKKDEKTKKR